MKFRKSDKGKNMKINTITVKRQEVFGILESEKVSKLDNFRENLVEFRGLYG